MGTFDGILSQVGSSLDVSQIAQHVGLPPDKVEAAIAALGSAQAQPGDTVQQASQSSGIEPGKLQEIVQQIGGEGALSQVSTLLGQSGAGNLAEKASGFFGGGKES